MGRAMTETAETRVRTLLVFLVTLFLAVWIGGSLVVDAMVIPSIFGLLPRVDAIDVGQAVFQRFNFLESLLGAATLLLAFALGRTGWGTRRRHLAATLVLLGMTLLSLVFLLGLTPAIIAKVQALRAAGVDLTGTDDMPPDRRALGTIHTIYAVLDLLKIVGGAVVFWLLAGRKTT